MFLFRRLACSINLKPSQDDGQPPVSDTHRRAKTIPSLGLKATGRLPTSCPQAKSAMTRVAHESLMNT